jgi:ribonuclease G
VEKELIIDSSKSGSEIALLEDSRLVELHQETEADQINVGDVFLGRVKKVIPGLNAAFVDVGYKKDAFLHYTDLSPNIRSLLKVTNLAVNGNMSHVNLKGFKYEPEIVKTGKIDDVLKNKQYILVQVIKEPISTKGPRLSCEITIPGRNLVLAPFGSSAGVSRRIESAEERKRLKILVESLKPENFGIVVRTVAQQKGAAELHKEIQELYDKWLGMMNRLKGGKPPLKVLSETDRTKSLLRDILNDSFNRVVVNDEKLSREIEDYIKNIAPKRKNLVSFYKGKTPIFDQYGVTRQIKSSFGKNVNLGSGAYLVIEHTEAMHVVDVNSGYKTSMKGDQESNALRVNLEAAQEVARQLRLRDIGGIILIDFIDMKKPEHKKQVFQSMKEFMDPDKATHTILPLSKFNLMQITRQRVRPEVKITTNEVCPTCLGTGKIQSSLLLEDEIERNIKTLSAKHAKLTIQLHPFMAAYFKKGFPSRRMNWFFDYKKWINIQEMHDFALTEYSFLDENEIEIELSQEGPKAD